MLLSYQTPRRIIKNALTKSWLRQIDQDAKRVFGFTETSWRKRPMTSNQVFNAKNPHIKRIPAKTVRCKDAKLYANVCRKTVIFLHFWTDHHSKDATINENFQWSILSVNIGFSVSDFKRPFTTVGTNSPTIFQNDFPSALARRPPIRKRSQFF